LKILFLCQLVPYPVDSGPKVRAYYVLRWLAQHHRVILLAFSRPDDRPEALEHLRSFCEEVMTIPLTRSRSRDIQALLISLVFRKPFVIQRDFHPEMGKKVDEMIATGQFQAVHSDQLWMAQYALRALGAQGGKPPVKTVLDEHNACFQIFQRLAQGEKNPLKKLILEREWRLLRNYEARCLDKFDQTVCITSEDRKTLESLETKRFKDSSKQIIPICVDPQEFPPVAVMSDQSFLKSVVHLGTMFWLPNVEGVLWFARQVWPLVTKHVPHARFTIIGKNPPAEIQSLAIEQTSISITGFVPEPRPYLEQAAAFVVPLLSGSGMRVKILDAWRWGVPVVSTQIGAEGIEVKNGENILLADRAQEFAQAIIRLLQETGLRQALRQNGRLWVEERYDWHKTYPAWEAVYGG
jgi:glycosyltransferase involved in cell wall biosynthesis